MNEHLCPSITNLLQSRPLTNLYWFYCKFRNFMLWALKRVSFNFTAHCEVKLWLFECSKMCTFQWTLLSQFDMYLKIIFADFMRDLWYRVTFDVRAFHRVGAANKLLWAVQQWNSSISSHSDILLLILCHYEQPTNCQWAYRCNTAFKMNFLETVIQAECIGLSVYFGNK